MFLSRKTYCNPDKDGPDVLKVEGTPVLANVRSIKQKRNGIEVSASPTSGPYVDKVWTVVVPKLRAGVYIGSEVTVYVDEKDADGDFYMEVDA